MRRAAARREGAMKWIIDPRNPGEVFACAGLAHLAWREDRTAETGFVNERGDYRHRFSVPDLSVPFDRLAKASLEKMGEGLAFAGVELDWWEEWGLNSELKIWAGNQKALTIHENLFSAIGDSKPSDWLEHRAPPNVKGKTKRRGIFNVDTDCAQSTLEMGFSPNEHGIKMLCRPWVGLLASIGLQAFSVRGSKKDRFRYWLWRPSAMAVAIAAFNGYGPSVYSTRGYISTTRKSGENTILSVAFPV